MHVIVQHSGWAYGDKSSMRRGVETREVTNKTKINQIVKLGGVVFDDYIEAENYCMRVQYPPGTVGLYPAVRGRFHRTAHIDGLRIYIPVADDATVNAEMESRGRG